MDGGRPGLGTLRGSRLLTPPADAAALKAALAAEARTNGFSTLGVTDPDSITGARERLQTFLDAGAHGDMDWLANEPARRASPKVLWSEVRSVIMLG
jgi:epoxyqueuosine reductase